MQLHSRLQAGVVQSAKQFDQSPRITPPLWRLLVRHSTLNPPMPPDLTAILIIPSQTWLHVGPIRSETCMPSRVMFPTSVFARDEACVSAFPDLSLGSFPRPPGAAPTEAQLLGRTGIAVAVAATVRLECDWSRVAGLQETTGTKQMLITRRKDMPTRPLRRERVNDVRHGITRMLHTHTYRNTHARMPPNV